MGDRKKRGCGKQTATTTTTTKTIELNREPYPIKKFWHWGPIIAISIIQTITLTTLYMNSMWWPPNESVGGFLNQYAFLALALCACFNFVMATTFGPGLLERQWRPENDGDCQHMQFCEECQGFKAPRSHHCRKCNRCVKKMDHHCPWINNCVGWANHAYFIYFLFYSICGSLHAAIVLTCSFYRGVYRYWYLTHNQQHLATVQFNMYSIVMCIFAMGLAIGVVIALSMLLYFQVKSVLSNTTGIESWIVEKALYRRMQNPKVKEFVYPYNVGWWQNMLNVFLTSRLYHGRGTEWPVLTGCDQYTLTREQIAQKSEKRARTKTFKCIHASTGRILPLLSQGWRVCLSPPCTDEPRIRLQPDDIIKVTRFRRHWLFGERVLRPDEKEKNLRKDEIRGWFPRRCTVELIEPPDPRWLANQLAGANGVGTHRRRCRGVATTADDSEDSTTTSGPSTASSEDFEVENVSSSSEVVAATTAPQANGSAGRNAKTVKEKKKRN